MHSLESNLEPNPLNLPANVGVSAGHFKSLVLPSSGSLVSPYNKGLRESHQVASMFPGVSDMFLVPIPDHNSHEACLLHRNRNAPKCRPGAGDVHSIHSLTTVSPPFANGDDSKSFFALISVSNEETSVLKRLGSDQFIPRVLGDRVKERLSIQAGLHSRAWGLQKRLQALLGHHALLHCDHQLEGLKTQCYHRGLSLDSISTGAQLSQLGPEHHFPWPETSPHFTEIKEFSQSSHAVFRGLQEAFDSDATANSSSDDELDDINMPSENRETCVSDCKRQWLNERAELGSRWSWLQLRVAELDGRIQQLEELHKNIRSNKGSVVLAESQPMTDRQIQQTLLREMAGLSYRVQDADNEPCSPTRLLYNIEIQSAELSQIVNSLMPPLSLSPLSKQPQTRKDKKAFNSDFFVPGSKRRKFGVRRRQLFKGDMSCVCARTRPLVTYHKPKLFVLNTGSEKFSGSTTFSLSSGLTSCSCSCSSCDPVPVCSDPDSSSSRTLSSRTYSSINHDSSLFSHSPKTSAREEWSQIPLIINAQPLSPVLYNSTPLHKNHKYKQYTRHHRKRVLGLSPIRHAGSIQRQQDNRKRKRRHRHIFREDDEECLSYYEDSSDEVMEESYTLVSRKQCSQGAVRRRQGETMFNIDNIVIPASLTKVEKLQYKDILTPSWQVVDIQSLLKSDAKTEEKMVEQLEVLTDEVFAQRHFASEQKEKMRWYFWGKKHCRHSSRSGSRLSSSGGGLCTSGEENSVEWSFAQLDIDELLNSEECLPQAPWERRVFPLNNEETLLCEVPHWCSDTTSSFSSSKSSNHDPGHLSQLMQHPPLVDNVWPV